MTKTQKRGKIPKGYGSVQLKGRRWWMVYRNSAGVKVQENSGTADRKEAEKELARRAIAVLQGDIAKLQAVIDETRGTRKRTGGDSTDKGQKPRFAARRAVPSAREAA